MRGLRTILFLAALAPAHAAMITPPDPAPYIQLPSFADFADFAREAWERAFFQTIGIPAPKVSSPRPRPAKELHLS